MCTFKSFHSSHFNRRRLTLCTYVCDRCREVQPKSPYSAVANGNYVKSNVFWVYKLQSSWQKNTVHTVKTGKKRITYRDGTTSDSFDNLQCHKERYYLRYYFSNNARVSINELCCTLNVPQDMLMMLFVLTCVLFLSCYFKYSLQSASRNNGQLVSSALLVHGDWRKQVLYLNSGKISFSLSPLHHDAEMVPSEDRLYVLRHLHQESIFHLLHAVVSFWV